MSLVNSTGTKFVKWTGSDLEVKGNIRADEGVIGGLTVTTSSIFLSGSIPPFIVSQSGYFKVGGEAVEGIFTPLGDISSSGVPTSWSTTTVNGSGSIDSKYDLRDSGAVSSGTAKTTYVGFDLTGSGQLFYQLNITEAGDGLFSTNIQKAVGTWASTPTTLVTLASQGLATGSLNVTSGKYRVSFSDSFISILPTLQQATLWFVPDAYFEFNPVTDTVTAGNALLKVGQGQGKLTIGGTNPLELANGNFVIDPAGNIDFRGNINASGGSIGGFTITDTDLYAEQINISSIGEIDVSNGQIFIASGSLSATGSNGTLRSSVGLVDTSTIRTDTSIPTTIYATTITAMTNAATVGATYKASFRLDYFDLFANGNGTFEINGSVNSARLQGYIDIYRNDGTTLITTYPFSQTVSSGLTTPSITYSGDANYSFIFTSPATEILKYRLRYQISNVSISFGGGTVYDYEWSADVDNFAVVESIGKTEIRTGGLQVWKEATVYFKVNRNAANSSPSTPFIELATDGGFTAAGNIIPLKDNLYDLGTTTTENRRWDDIYATNGTIQTSDARQKEDIYSSDLGLGFINQLRPVSYKWIGKTRTHFGFIAQEIQSSLELNNKTSNDFAGLITGSSDEIYWGLRYQEFIAPMVKAIQELSEKVERLEAQISGSNNT